MEETKERQLRLPTEFPADFCYTDEKGLTEAEAASAAAAGRGNQVTVRGEKSFQSILRSNLFTLFNALNFAIGACLLVVGSYRNMLFLLVVIANIGIGTVQEWRAQKTIRRLQLMNTSDIHVLRDGREIAIPPAEAVQGDLVILRSGDQVPADAVVIGGRGAAMEAILTGESNAVEKEINSWVYSGSYITEGRLTAQLVYVGDESYLGRLTREARKTARPASELTDELKKLIRWDSMLLVPLGILLFLKQTFIHHLAAEAAVPSAAAAMLGMIPEGLILLTSVAMAVGVVKLGRRQALVQELAGIETLARVDVLCLDKTGTITTGKMELEALLEAEATEEEIRLALSRFLSAFDERSGTLDALRSAITPTGETPKAVVPFSSARKKSAVTFRDGLALILGAPEFVLGEAYPESLRQQAAEQAAKGRRVLVLAGSHGIVTEEKIPTPDRIYGLVVLRDQIRPGVKETLRYFREQGVQIKLISGDDPRTVSRIAREAGVEGWDQTADLSSGGEDPAEICEQAVVFGRVTPEQKKLLVQALRERGHHVAMTGDGVNDIPAMKTANCSIAMAEGSDAARHAAQLTLLTSDFTVMPEIVLEGRRVINNITRAASLFLTKTIFSLLLSLLMLFFPGAYPFQPIQLTLLSSLMIGIPGFFLALEPSSERISGNFLKTVLMRALPGGAAIALCASLTMSLTAFGWERSLCSTISILIACVISYTVLIRTCMPLNGKRGLLLGAIAAAFVIAVTAFGHIFFLSALNGSAWTALIVLAVVGHGILLGTDFIIRRKMGRKSASAG